jgi:TPR repeat protein
MAAAPPTSEARDAASLKSLRTSSDSITRKPVTLSPTGNTSNAPRLRDAPISPVRVNFQQDNWAQPSNADIEHAQPQSTQFDLAYRRRQPDPSDPEPSQSRQQNSDTGDASIRTVSSQKNAGFQPEVPRSSAAGPERYEASAISAHERVRNQDMFRNSRESDDTTSTNRQATSIESAPTSTSSVSGIMETPDCQPSEDSPDSSIIEGNLPRGESVPQFQYHHDPQYPPQRVASVPNGDPRTISNPDLLENASHIRRHLTPNNNNNFRRSSIPRPHSSYSVYSDNASRSRSPGLMPGVRTPSAQSRKSPDARMSTYGELLNVPYPQQAPAPLVLDNSDLRNVIGNNASLLSAQKTLEMYRVNVKKTNDFSIQYSFAVFLISTAQEQGLDVTNPKTPKSPAPPKEQEGGIIEGSVGNPYELVREARQILQRLANGGYPFAQYYLADGYASGLFSKGKEDYNTAFPLFVLAAKHGHAESGYRTGLCYEFGWGCRKDPAKAVQFLRAAASKRHPGAMTRLGKACLSGDLGEKRYREGIKWLKLATESADAQYNAAPYQLGCLYETGYGDDIFQDLTYAAELFTQAADLGHPEANFRMGDSYEHGKLGCPKDPGLSVHFYTGAAERGHAAAMMGLCAWYMVGAPPILEKDEEEAYEWARRSAELGFVKAEYAVGYFTEMGIGCRRDILEANVWYVKAADAGDERAKQRLAIIQAAVSGQGTPMEVGPAKSSKLQRGGKDDKDCVVM